MKANVGMTYAVAAPVNSYTQGSAITYGTGYKVGESRGANVTWETEDGEFYGDNAILDVANGVLGYNIELETAGLQDSVRKDMLGEVKDSSDAYHITGASAPDVGFGYVKTMRDDASGSVVTTYECWWYHVLKFSEPNEEARTKEKNVEWRTPTISGKGKGVFLSESATDPDFAEHKTFSTLANAKSWLNTKANISEPVVTTT